MDTRDQSFDTVQGNCQCTSYNEQQGGGEGEGNDGGGGGGQQFDSTLISDPNCVSGGCVAGQLDVFSRPWLAIRAAINIEWHF